MPKTYIKDGSNWREVLRPYVKDGGTWRPIKKIWVKVNGVWQQVFGNSGAEVFAVGSVTWTVPAGVYSITATGCGGGGQGGNGDGGANDSGGSGSGGGGSNLISQSYSVTPGQVLNISVGAGGNIVPKGDGQNGFPTSISGTGVSFSAAGGQGGGGVSDWNGGTGKRAGLGANGANHLTTAHTQSAGTSTNGGANGGAGGNYSRSGDVARTGSPGQNGKLTIVF